VFLLGACGKDSSTMTRGEVCAALTEPMATASARCMAQLGMGSADDLYAANRRAINDECCRGTQCQAAGTTTRRQLDDCLAALKKLDCSDPAVRSQPTLLPSACTSILAGAGGAADVRGSQRSAKRLNSEVEARNFMGVVGITVKNRDAFDWTNVKVCINDHWCADGPRGSSEPTIKAGDQWILNWFMQNSIAYREAVRAGQVPGKDTISDFVDERGSQNKLNEPINSITVYADEGTWSQSY
jgi:hypothetical protein